MTPYVMNAIGIGACFIAAWAFCKMVKI